MERRFVGGKSILTFCHSRTLQRSSQNPTTKNIKEMLWMARWIWTSLLAPNTPRPLPSSNSLNKTTRSFSNLLLKPPEKLQLKQCCTPAARSYFMKFYFLKWNNFERYDFLKSRWKVMPFFVFYLWRNLWQTFRTAVNFLYNSPLILISGQVFNQPWWKLTQM